MEFTSTAEFPKTSSEQTYTLLPNHLEIWAAYATVYKTNGARQICVQNKMGVCIINIIIIKF